MENLTMQTDIAIFGEDLYIGLNEDEINVRKKHLVFWFMKNRLLR